MAAEVSIVTPCYNCSKYIQATIDSVVAQTSSNWEMIIVDDCSSDSSFEIAKENSRKDPRIRALGLDTWSGPTIARNIAIEKAKGRYIAFLDSDDLWLPEKLEKQIEVMKNKDAVFSYTGYEKIDENGYRKGRRVSVPESGNYNDLLTGCFIGCLTAVYDAKQIGKVYFPQIKRGQDYGLWLKILRSGYIAFGLNEVLALYRERRESLSSSKLKKAYYQWRIYRDLEELSLIKCAACFSAYSIKGVQKWTI